ncbi:MAG: SDR family oxidoreductase [Gemmatales bacterium]
MRILITGASGHLGRRLVKEACQAGHKVWAWTSPRDNAAPPSDLSATFASVEMTNPLQVAEAYSQIRPMAVIHAAALANVAECYRDPIRAYRVNAEATRQLAGLCVADIARLIYVSTDLVFDGTQGNYQEDDTPRPLSQYGKSKLDGERAVIHHPGLLVARVSWLIGTGTPRRAHFLDQQIATLRQGQPLQLFRDEWRSPLGMDAAAQALLALAASDVSGVLHLGGPERLSRYEMGCILAKRLGTNPNLVQSIEQSEMKTPEPRPSDVSFNSTRWRQLMPNSAWPTFEEAVKHEFGL